MVAEKNRGRRTALGTEKISCFYQKNFMQMTPIPVMPLLKKGDKILSFDPQDTVNLLCWIKSNTGNRVGLLQNQGTCSRWQPVSS